MMTLLAFPDPYMDAYSSASASSSYSSSRSSLSLYFQAFWISYQGQCKNWSIFFRHSSLLSFLYCRLLLIILTSQAYCLDSASKSWGLTIFLVKVESKQGSSFDQSVNSSKIWNGCESLRLLLILDVFCSIFLVLYRLHALWILMAIFSFRLIFSSCFAWKICYLMFTMSSYISLMEFYVLIWQLGSFSLVFGSLYLMLVNYASSLKNREVVIPFMMILFTKPLLYRTLSQISSLFFRLRTKASLLTWCDDLMNSLENVLNRSFLFLFLPRLFRFYFLSQSSIRVCQSYLSLSFPSLQSLIITPINLCRVVLLIQPEALLDSLELDFFLPFTRYEFIKDWVDFFLMPMSLLKETRLRRGVWVPVQSSSFLFLAVVSLGWSVLTMRYSGFLLSRGVFWEARSSFLSFQDFISYANLSNLCMLSL